MTGTSRALAGLVAIVGLAVWGIALTLAGDDVPLVPPSVELGGPPVTVAPALPSGGADAADDGPVDPNRTGGSDAAPATEEGEPDADVAEASTSSSDDGREETARSPGAVVVAPVPVRVAGDSSTPTSPTPAPANPTVDRPATAPSTPTTSKPPVTASPDLPDTAAPEPTSTPTPRHSPPAATPEPDPGGEGQAFHVATEECQVLDAPGLTRAAERTAGTPASPPPQGCPGGPARGAQGPSEDPGERGRDGGELKAVREQDDDDHGREDSGRGGGGRGGRGLGGG